MPIQRLSNIRTGATGNTMGELRSRPVRECSALRRVGHDAGEQKRAAALFGDRAEKRMVDYHLERRRPGLTAIATMPTLVAAAASVPSSSTFT